MKSLMFWRYMAFTIWYFTSVVFWVEVAFDSDCVIDHKSPSFGLNLPIVNKLAPPEITVSATAAIRNKEAKSTKN